LGICVNLSRATAAGRYRSAVGFNPYRARTKRASDLVLVAAAFAIVLALVLWAVLG
jgi:hypothetical protein